MTAPYRASTLRIVATVIVRALLLCAVLACFGWLFFTRMIR